MPLRSSRKNTRNRVRVFENRSPYGPDMARRSFQKIQVLKSDSNLKNWASWAKAGKIPPGPDVDRPVDRVPRVSTALSTGGGRAVWSGAPFLIWAWLCGLVLESSEI